MNQSRCLQEKRASGWRCLQTARDHSVVLHWDDLSQSLLWAPEWVLEPLLEAQTPFDLFVRGGNKLQSLFHQQLPVASLRRPMGLSHHCGPSAANPHTPLEPLSSDGPRPTILVLHFGSS